jgi:hypothetical protein
MSFIFPTNPSIGQTYGVSDNIWSYDGFGWQKVEAGISGGTQGLQGTQGIQGPAGSGTSVQGLQGIQGTQGSQGIQGDSGSEGAQGTQGSQGTQGIAGSQGTQGLQGVKGDSFETGIPYTGVTKESSFTTGTQGLARKIAFLTPGGSITYDFIRNYDVFNPTDLEFGIKTFTSNITTPSLMGATAFSLNGFNISASYNPVGVPTVSGATLSSSSSYVFGFPITISSPFTSFSFTTQGITYAPTAPQSTTITLTATDGTSTDTENITITFWNNVYYGVNSDTSLSGTNIPSNLTNVLSNTRNRSFTVTAGAGEYIYYAFPNRLDTSAIAFVVGGFEGGFEDKYTQTVSNSKGFSETYAVYRSTNQNLGTTTVVVQNG